MTVGGTTTGTINLELIPLLGGHLNSKKKRFGSQRNTVRHPSSFYDYGEYKYIKKCILKRW